jgi:hypothetical protein
MKTKTPSNSLSTDELVTVTGGGFTCDTANGCGFSSGGINYGSGGVSFDLGKSGWTVGPNGLGYKWLK